MAEALTGTAAMELLREAEARGSAVVAADRVADVGLDMPGLVTCPRDRGPAGALEALDDSFAAAPAELPESEVAGSAEATAQPTAEPAPASTPATAKPKQSSVTFFNAVSPILSTA